MCCTIGLENRHPSLTIDGSIPLPSPKLEAEPVRWLGRIANPYEPKGLGFETLCFCHIRGFSRKSCSQAVTLILARGCGALPQPRTICPSRPIGRVGRFRTCALGVRIPPRAPNSASVALGKLVHSPDLKFGALWVRVPPEAPKLTHYREKER